MKGFDNFGDDDPQGCDGFEEKRDVVQDIKQYRRFIGEVRALNTRIGTNGNTFAFCKTEFFREDEHEVFVHGFNTFMPVHFLAEAVLGENEKIASLEKISFKKPIERNGYYVLYEESERDSYLDQEEKASCLGSFITTEGRRFYFVAVQLGQPVNRMFNGVRNWANDMVGTANIKVDDAETGVCNFIRTLPEGVCQIVKENPALVSRLVLEAVIQHVLRLVYDMAEVGGYAGYRAFAYDFEDIDLGVDVGEIFKGGETMSFTFHNDQIRMSKAGYIIYPFSFRFGERKWSKGKMAVMFEVQ